MGIKRYIANQDNTITNAFAANLLTRGVSGNMGQSDILEVFSIFGQASSASSELERILVQFPVSEIITDRTAGSLPASGSMSFYLRMFNAKHSWTTPRDYTLDICPISRSWCEGLGLDMEDYRDLDASNWIQTCDGFTSACLTLTVHATGNFAVDPTFSAITLSDGPYFGDPADHWVFDGTDDATPPAGEFYLGLSVTEAATNIAAIINTSASAAYKATANGAVVTICTVPAGAYGNIKTVSVRPGAGGAHGVTFATLTGSDLGFPAESGAPQTCIDCGACPPGEKLCIASFVNGADTGGTEGINWTTEGGDYLSSPCFSQSFDTGNEDLEVDITPLVEDWIDGTIPNNGVGVKLSATDEGDAWSYYTKMFFARGSQFFFKRPILEARWNSSKQDDRGNFFLSSSLVPAADNLMKLYLYNIVKGQLTNIPAVGTGKILVSVYSGSSDNSAPFSSKLNLPVGGGVAATGDVNITASFVETGVYSASFAYVSSSITTIFDVWHSASIEYHTGSAITVNTFNSKNFNFDQRYVSKIVNLRPTYSRAETSRFRLYVREKNWSPNIYTIASNVMPDIIIDNSYYQLTRISDNFKVIPYGTGSTNYTKLSYDTSGSYFNLDMSLLESDTFYTLKFAYLINGSYVEQPEEFRFKVE